MAQKSQIFVGTGMFSTGLDSVKFNNELARAAVFSHGEEMFQLFLGM